MALRRDTAASLLACWGDEARFLRVIRLSIELGRLSKKEAERVIVRRHMDPARLLSQLDDWANR